MSPIWFIIVASMGASWADVPKVEFLVADKSDVNKPYKTGPKTQQNMNLKWRLSYFTLFYVISVKIPGVIFY